MKIISGIYKNRSLKSPNSTKTHPMGNREKIALFNILQPYLRDAHVLDAFAGTGALGLEALSRGAQSATFIEKSPKIAQTLRENIQEIAKDRIDNIHLITKPATEAALLLADQHFDIIIADPPYDHFLINDITPLANLLSNNGIFVLSHPDASAPLFSEKLTLIKTRAYAAAHLSFYQKA